MDPSVFQCIQNFGALGILALMVYLLPKIIATISTHIQTCIASVRETQTEALNVFKTEQQSLIDMVDRRFSAIEAVLTKLVENVTTLVSGVKTLDIRVESLERDKSK